MAEARRKANSDFLAVVAVDFGTTGSGIAIAHRATPNEIYAEQELLGAVPGAKTLTSLLTERDGKTLVHFGNKAESEYLENSEGRDWRFFHRFKMCLYGNLKQRPVIRDYVGREYPALDIFTAALRHMRNVALKRLQEGTHGRMESTDVRWVLTVPAIWGNAAKQLMREAARAAGMCEVGDDQLIFALEPEAAALYCRKVETLRNAAFRPGSKYIIVDAGGGTLDIVADDCALAFRPVVHNSYRGPFGGNYINHAFEGLLRDIVGEQTLATYKQSYEVDYHDMIAIFEQRKWDTSPTEAKDRRIRVPSSLVRYVQEQRGTTLSRLIANSRYAGTISHARDDLKIGHEQMLSLFKPCVDSIVQKVISIAELKECSTVFLVGGFANSEVLRSALAKAVGDKLCRPAQPGFAVLKGAVMFGLDESTISARVMTKTWGLNTGNHYSEQHRKDGRPVTKITRHGKPLDYHFGDFTIFAQAGNSVDFNQSIKRDLTPVYHDQKSMNVDIYSSTGTPAYVDSKGCVQEGTLLVPMPVAQGDLDRRVEILFEFGATEVRVTGKDVASGHTRRLEIDFFAAAS